MTTHHEPTSDLALNLPDNWQVELGPHEAIALLALAPEDTLPGVNIVATVEAPPEELQDLKAYVDEQTKQLQEAFAHHNIAFLGYREYTTETEDVILSTHSRTEDATVIASYQIYTINHGIATALTLTLPLAYLDLGYHISIDLIRSFQPATALYDHAFYQD